MEVPEKQTSSYRYWVRETTADAAPLPVPKKLSDDDLSKQPSQNSIGSVWNKVILFLDLFVLRAYFFWCDFTYDMAYYTQSNELLYGFFFGLLPLFCYPEIEGKASEGEWG